jgi:hypothetical protein
MWPFHCPDAFMSMTTSWESGGPSFTDPPGLELRSSPSISPMPLTSGTSLVILSRANSGSSHGVHLEWSNDLAIRRQLVVRPVPRQLSLCPVSKVGNVRPPTEANDLSENVSNRCAAVQGTLLDLLEQVIRAFCHGQEGTDAVRQRWFGTREWTRMKSAEVRAKFFTARASGATLKQAVAAAGVSKTTGHYWLTQSGGVRPRVRRPQSPLRSSVEERAMTTPPATPNRKIKKSPRSDDHV